MTGRFSDAVEQLDGDTADARREARETLIAAGDAAIPDLCTALSDERQPVRWGAAKALGRLALDDAAPALVQALADRDSEVQWLAAEALGQIGHASVRPLLRELDQRHDQPRFRERAHHALKRLAVGDREAALRRVMEAIKGPAPASEIPSVSRQALKALGLCTPQNLADFRSVHHPLRRPLLVLTGTRGTLACGYLSLDALTRAGDAAALVSGVESHEEMLEAEVFAVTPAAEEVGVHVGMRGADALSRFA